MSKYSFSPAERYAVFTVHGEKCYLCNKPVDLKSMQVDHVIPESLLDSADLPEVLNKFGLSQEFQINDFGNWLPACQPCNGRKRNTVFKPTPIIQIELQRLADKEEEARNEAKRIVTNQKIENAINTLQRAGVDNLSREQVTELKPLVDYHFENPARDDANAPFRITQLYEVLSDDGAMQVVKGPFGIGRGPVDPSPDARCSGCGFAAFNGARCVFCGMMDDD